MPLYSETLSLPPSTFAILRDLIHERTGLYYAEDQRDMLADKLSPRVIALGFGSFLDYYYLLKYDAASDEEWRALLNALSVQETFFCREADQVRTLVEVLIPQYVAANPGVTVRIWSAACATGEEPLSIAMALDQAGWFSRAPITILASDASSAAIEKARSGLYRDRSFRSVPESLRARYFTAAGGAWRIDPQIHARVTWAVANVTVDEEIRHLSTAPFIFCRNAFIYFSERTIRKTVDLFRTYQPTPGYLFVGASESLLRITTSYQLCEIGGTFVYVKGAC
ncbi:MAG TPA: CheR family methyltransferase [Herpetosiphonaceae bacterium]